MTRHYPDLGSASDWLKQISHAAKPITSTTQIWVVKRHQYGISAPVSQASHGKVWFSTLRPLTRVNPGKARQSQHARGLLTRESTTTPLSVDKMVAALQLECLKYADNLHAL